MNRYIIGLISKEFTENSVKVELSEYVRKLKLHNVLTADSKISVILLTSSPTMPYFNSEYTLFRYCDIKINPFEFLLRELPGILSNYPNDTIRVFNKHSILEVPEFIEILKNGAKGVNEWQ